MTQCTAHVLHSKTPLLAPYAILKDPASENAAHKQLDHSPSEHVLIDDAPDNDSSMKIVFASHSHFSKQMVVGSHHLARRLVASGHQVLHISAPLTIPHLLRLEDQSYRERFHLWKSGGRQIEENLREYVPLSPVPWQFARCCLSRKQNLFLHSCPTLGFQFHRFGFERPDLLLIDEPRLVGIDRFLAPSAYFYRSTDLNAELKGDPSITKAERFIIERADGCVGTSAPVVDSLRAVDPVKPVLLLENGVEFTFFSTPRDKPLEYRSLPGPIAVYVGALDKRFDYAAIVHLATARPELSIVLIGPQSIPIPDKIGELKNVHLLGSKAYVDVPAFLQHAQIGLLPLTGHAANRGRSPMKLYEYAAAGLPVVATKSEELARRREPFVHTFEGASAIVPAAMAALADTEAPAQARRVASSMDWASKADELLTFIQNSTASKLSSLS